MPVQAPILPGPGAGAGMPAPPPPAAAAVPRHRSTALHVLHVLHNVSVMPWPCLQAAIVQILQEDDEETQEEQLEKWREMKNAELLNVSFVGTLIAGAVTGSIQWSALQTAHWFVSACWYTTLTFSLLSVMVAFYLSILLSNFAIHPRGLKLLLRSLRQTNDPKSSRKASLFALQVPLQLLSYSLIGYILGLGLLVLRPLWTEPWGNQSYVAVCFIVFLTFGIGTFGTVCHFIYVQNEEVLKFD